MFSLEATVEQSEKSDARFLLCEARWLARRSRNTLQVIIPPPGMTEFYPERTSLSAPFLAPTRRALRQTMASQGLSIHTLEAT
jgi:hypothetical protein